MPMNIFSFVLILVCCAAIPASGRELLQLVQNSSVPWFCRDGPCSSYQLLNRNSQFEIRQYDPAFFVQNTGTGANYSAAFTAGFSPGYRYLNGFNSANLTFPTVGGYLIASTIIAPDNSSTVTVNLPILPQMLNDTSLAPMPLNQNVSLAAGYGGVFAVASYGGIADGASVQSTGSQLKADLAATGIKFKEPYLSVIYDVPVRVTNRHNELWLQLLNYNGTVSRNITQTAG